MLKFYKGFYLAIKTNKNVPPEKMLRPLTAYSQEWYEFLDGWYYAKDLLLIIKQKFLSKKE